MSVAFCLQLWTAAGVRTCFGPRDLVSRLNALPADRNLTATEFDLAIKLLRHVVKTVDVEQDVPSLGIRQLPSQSRRMRPLGALFANDAQWIVGGEGTDTPAKGITNVLHTDVPRVLGPALRVRSVRERLLRGTQTARAIACPSARGVAAFNKRRNGTPSTRRRTGARGSSCLRFVCSDLMRTLDKSALKATWVHVHADETFYPSERLVHTYVRSQLLQAKLAAIVLVCHPSILLMMRSLSLQPLCCSPTGRLPIFRDQLCAFILGRRCRVSATPTGKDGWSDAC